MSAAVLCIVTIYLECAKLLHVPYMMKLLSI